VIGEHVGHMPLWCFLGPTPLTRRVPSCGAGGGLDADREKPLDLLHALCAACWTGALPVGTLTPKPPARRRSRGAGVCQDHAHIFIGAARLLGLPARYVSGYLMMDDRVDQEAAMLGRGACAGLGWVGFDVLERDLPDTRYVDWPPLRLSRCGARHRISIGAGQIALEVSLALTADDRTVARTLGEVEGIRA
jgi:hypothetical protein